MIQRVAILPLRRQCCLGLFSLAYDAIQTKAINLPPHHKYHYGHALILILGTSFAGWVRKFHSEGKRIIPIVVIHDAQYHTITYDTYDSPRYG